MIRTIAQIAVLAFAACAAGGDESDAFAQDGWRTDFSRHVVPLSEIVSGGPPKDGIPALDRPRFVTVRAAGRKLSDREPVILLEHSGTVRIYPIRILLWHEIVNDRVGDLPVAVTYCPLCNTALVLDRRHKGRVLDFGTTGRLRHSDMVMYDRQTESWWQQATGEGLVGTYAGDTLRLVPSAMVSWATAKRAHPSAEVLSDETGFDRPYGTTPYAGYDAPGGSPIAEFFGGKKDDRLPAMERVATVQIGREWVAYPFSRLSRARVANDVVGGHALAVFWTPGTASALDARELGSSRDVGATGVFDRQLNGRTLTFQPDGAGGFRDRETGSRWNVLGHAVAGELRGSRLRRITSADYFWFAWAVFRPQTRIWK